MYKVGFMTCISGLNFMAAVLASCDCVYLTSYADATVSIHRHSAVMQVYSCTRSSSCAGYNYALSRCFCCILITCYSMLFQLLHDYIAPFQLYTGGQSSLE